MLSLMRPKNHILVRSYTSEDGSPTGALLCFKGDLNKQLLARFQNTFALEGDHVKTGGRLSPSYMLTLLGSGGGALGMSGVMSGQLFMATANPATLMTVGNGVGSAVMGASGIVAHAPFIPVAGALMPVVAPLLAFQAISTVMIMQQFKGIHERMDQIEKSINRILQRTEATYIGEIISASNRIDELKMQFGVCNQFTPDMIVRLALIEDKVNPVFERYRFLYQSQSIGRKASSEDLKFKLNDAYFAIVLSILDLQIDLLKLRLAIQENAAYMRASAARLIDKVAHYETLWQEISADASLLEQVAEDVRKAVSEMNWWQRNVPSWMGGRRSERKDLEKDEARFLVHAKAAKAAVSSELGSAIQLGEMLRPSVAEAVPMNIVYWRDRLGDHCYYTEDLQLIESA